MVSKPKKKNSILLLLLYELPLTQNTTQMLTVFLLRLFLFSSVWKEMVVKGIKSCKAPAKDGSSQMVNNCSWTSGEVSSVSYRQQKTTA